MKKHLIACLLLTSSILAAQDSLNINLLGHLDYQPVGADVWGYTAPDGSEYAIMGLRDGITIVDINQTPQLTEVLRIQGVPSVWRDIKTWAHYAYVTHDQTLIPQIMPAEGITIIDLDSIEFGKVPEYWKTKTPIALPSGTVIDSVETSHNLYIDKNGIMYLFGSDFLSGGAIMYDLTIDPENPQFVGMWMEEYLHDGMARGDTLWGSAVWAGEFFVIDVSNKANPQTLASFPTSSQFTHNCWISDDNKTLYTTDEVPRAYIDAYDVSDLSNITQVDRINSSLSSFAIPHNTHFFDDYLVTSYYTSGLQIVDVHEPDIMVEVAYYDTHPQSADSSFSGAWGAYPYFPSGKIAVSDMQAGLFIFSSDYPRAGYWRGTVVDGQTMLPLPTAQITETNGLFSGTADINGRFKWGGLDSTIQVDVALNGYNSTVQNLAINPGITNTDTIFLMPLGFGISDEVQSRIRVFPNPSNGGQFHITGLEGDTRLLQVMDMQGREIQRFDVLGMADETDILCSLSPGVYKLIFTDTEGRQSLRRQFVR